MRAAGMGVKGEYGHTRADLRRSRGSAVEWPPRGTAMDEVEWLTCGNPLPMLDFLSGKVSARKVRLFAVAAYRRIRHWVVDPDSRWAIEVAEQFVAQQAGRGELAEAWAAAHRYYLNSYKD